MELITVTARAIGAETTATVNARDLHAFLEVGKDFSTWIKDRIDQYQFLENQDFVCPPILGSEGRGGHNRKDYHLSLDMAKELSMVERNEKGKQARAYFLECERRARAGALAIPQTLPEALRLAADLADQKAKAEAALAIAAPKAAALDLIAADDEALTMTQAAKVLGQKREALTNWLHAHGWIYRQNGAWVAYDQHIKNGRLQFKEARYTDERTGQECRRPYCHIMPKGLAKLAEVFGVELKPREPEREAA